MRPIFKNAATLGVAILFVAGAAGDASAKISKKQKEELEGYAAKIAETSDSEAKQALLYVKGAVADSKTRKELEGFRSDENKKVSLGAHVALVLAGDKKADDALAAELATRGRVYDTLRMSIAPLPDAMEDDVIEKLLESKEAGVRPDTLRYLAEQRGELFEIIESALVGKDEALRKDAGEALVSARRTDVFDTLKKALGSKDDGVRRSALETVLGFSKLPNPDPEAAKLLLVATKDKSPSIREEAARRLVEMGDASGVPVLLEIAEGKPKPEETAEVLAFVVAHEGKASRAAVEKWMKGENAAAKQQAYALVAASKDAKLLDELIEMHRSTEFDDRLLAVRTMGLTRDAKASKALQKSLFEQRDDIRKAAAEGLRAYGKPDALPSLERALGLERNDEIKLVIIDAIGAAGGDDALQLLRFQVTNNDVEYKKHVIEAIRATGLKGGAKALDVLLRDRNTEVQWRAFLAAMSLDPAVAKPQFKNIFRNPAPGFLLDVDELDSAQRKLVYDHLLAEGLGSVREKVVRRVMHDPAYDDVLYELALASATDSSLRKDLVHHFGNRANKKDILVLERIARGPNKTLARLAAWMLTRHPSPSLEASYRGYLASKDPVLSAIAAYGLATVWR